MSIITSTPAPLAGPAVDASPINVHLAKTLAGNVSCSLYADGRLAAAAMIFIDENGSARISLIGLPSIDHAEAILRAVRRYIGGIS